LSEVKDLELTSHLCRRSPSFLSKKPHSFSMLF
jgi:hypothetical protein